MRSNIVNQIARRAKKAFDNYDREIRPHYKELVSVLEPQADKLGVGVRALVELLHLFEEIRRTQEVAVGKAREGAELEEAFWNDFAQETTLAMNLGEIINTPDVMADLVAKAPIDTLEYVIKTQDPERQAIIRQLLDD